MKVLQIRNSIGTVNHKNCGIAVTRVINAVASGKNNINATHCACSVCKASGNPLPIESGKGYPVFINNGAAFVHESHIGEVVCYHGTNVKNYVGKPANNGQEVSPEIEIRWATDNAFARAAVMSYMLDKGFTAERDCTVDVEFTSYIARKMNGLAQIFAALMAFVDAGWVKFDSRCGTHLNISTNKLRDIFPDFSMSKMRGYLNEATRYMAEHSDDIEVVFGRGGYTDYADINDTSYQGHGCALNMYHIFACHEAKEDARFEYRICKFNGDDANRYMEMVKRLVEFTDALMDAYKENAPYSVAYNLMAKVMKVVEA